MCHLCHYEPILMVIVLAMISQMEMDLCVLYHVHNHNTTIIARDEVDRASFCDLSIDTSSNMTKLLVPKFAQIINVSNEDSGR